jgi:hypothetical protein
MRVEMSVSSYSETLHNLAEKYMISSLIPIDNLVHSAAKNIYRSAVEIADKVSDTLGRSCRVGGSCYVKNGRSFLLKGEDIDIDINIWISPTETIPEFLPILTKLFENKVLPEAPESTYLGTAKTRYLIAGVETEIHLKFRDEKDAARKSFVETRHDLMTDEDYLLYMNLKYQLKMRNGPDYEEFKKLEMAALKE